MVISETPATEAIRDNINGTDLDGIHNESGHDNYKSCFVNGLVIDME